MKKWKKFCCVVGIFVWKIMKSDWFDKKKKKKLKCFEVKYFFKKIKVKAKTFAKHALMYWLGGIE
jgi:hypothetical protein